MSRTKGLSWPTDEYGDFIYDYAEINERNSRKNVRVSSHLKRHCNASEGKKGDGDFTEDPFHYALEKTTVGKIVGVVWLGLTGQ